MQKLLSKVTDAWNFYEGNEPGELLSAHGSPLYVYNERILRQRCREMRNLVDYAHLEINYSAKANTNVRLLEIIRDEGLHTDAMSPGEILAVKAAGFTPDKILFVSNNVSEHEMRFALDHKLPVCVDSLSQLEMFGRINPGGAVAVRINPGVGQGHCDKVVTGGGETKFGVNMEYADDLRAISKKYNLHVNGIHFHIGSLFMEGDVFFTAVRAAMAFAMGFDDLDFLDFGGGFGIPYAKAAGEAAMDLRALGHSFSGLIADFMRDYGKEIVIKLEPGRFIVAECGVLLGRVLAVKHNGETCFAGTDIGFNVLPRPVIYGSRHEIELYRPHGAATAERKITVVGNICETGDILSRDVTMPMPVEGDIMAVLDTGAYCFVMASTYNQRPLPAEVLITQDGGVRLIRRRQAPEELLWYLEC